MKLRHLRRRTLLHSRHPNRWRPLGYYRNRPHILRAVAWQGIGIIERVSMIVSDSAGLNLEPSDAPPPTSPPAAR